MTIQENVTGLGHLGIPAIDLEKTVKWYTELLGFEVIYDGNLPEEPCHAVFVQKGNLVIEIYQNDEKMVEELKTRGHGHIDHVALAVTDVDEAFAKMKKTGCTFLDAEVQYLPLMPNGVKWFTVLGPNGEKVEFNQVL